MQYSNIIILALAAGAVAQNSTTKAGGKSASATEASATGKATGMANGNSTASGKASATGGAKASSTGKAGNASMTSTGGTVKATTNGAPSLLAQSGGFVTVAGLGVAFAVFM